MSSSCSWNLAEDSLPSPKEIEQKLSEQDDINQEGQKT